MMRSRPEMPLGYLLNRAAQEIREGTVAVLAPAGLSPQGFGLLLRLREGGPMSQRQLGASHRVDRTTMVALVDQLEARGWVRREDDPADRRRYAVTLTAAGAALLAATEGPVLEVERRFLAALSADEAATLRRLLGRLLENLGSEAADAPAHALTERRS